MKSQNTNHEKTIIEQFSQQAKPFSELPGHHNSIKTLLTMSNVNKNDLVLDVACGPGLVTCEFAERANHVTGIDITEKMISQAKSYQQEKGLINLSWDIGTVLPLPYKSDSFSIVVTRYSFHHFLKPQAVLDEMIRVCKPSGKVMFIDVVQQPEKAEAYDHLEKLRDPSHVHALTFPEIAKLASSSGLSNIKTAQYKVEGELEQQLKASFPNPGDEDKIREIFKSDLEFNKLGINIHQQQNEIHFAVPITVVVGVK
jgi:ubiquinone/menaquinone biosynthesis C-methylase UbiE